MKRQRMSQSERSELAELMMRMDPEEADRMALEAARAVMLELEPDVQWDLSGWCGCGSRLLAYPATRKCKICMMKDLDRG